jgi:alkyl sulfatase BDS1-like metallo-beta-lactamase superfamily hydrolase
MTPEDSNSGSDSKIMDSVSSEFAKTVSGELKQVAEGIYLLPGFGNCTLIVADGGAAVVDPGLFQTGPRVLTALRSLTDLPVRYVVYTHGHYDHAFGTPAILEDAAERGFAAPTIVGHANVAKRFARYQKTAGHLAETYTMQFASWAKGGVLGGGAGGDVVRKAIYVPPTLEYEDRIALGLGGLTLHCRHGLGETDDHTWVWVPERKVIVGGDFIVSSIPNAGTPFRVQRYVLEWAEALEEMAGLEPAAVVSGHGGVFRGEQVLEMLKITSKALRYLEDEVVRRLNEGQWYEEILQAVELPEALAASPFLQPVYGCTAFAVHSILRRYTGWYDGNPSHLFPSPGAEIAGEVLALAGGANAVLQRARTLVAKGERAAIQRSLHLLDFVIEGGAAQSEEVEEARSLKAETLEARAEHEDSFIARNILASAAVLEKGRGREA